MQPKQQWLSQGRPGKTEKVLVKGYIYLPFLMEPADVMELILRAQMHNGSEAHCITNYYKEYHTYM